MRRKMFFYDYGRDDFEDRDDGLIYELTVFNHRRIKFYNILSLFVTGIYFSKHTVLKEIARN